jgi:hypothetical protein
MSPSNSHDTSALVGEVIENSKGLSYPGALNVNAPQPPKVPIRSAGFLGLGQNAQDKEAQNAAITHYQIEQEREYLQATCVVGELKGLALTTQGTQRAEQYVAGLDHNSAHFHQAVDVGSRMMSRMVAFNDLLSESQQAQCLEIFQRRRMP